MGANDNGIMEHNILFSALGLVQWLITNTTSVGVACVFIFLATWEFRSWYRLRHVPGPFWHSLSIYPMNKLARSGRMSFILKEYGDKYGMRTSASM